MSPRWSMAQTCIRRGLPREVTPELGLKPKEARCRTCEGLGTARMTASAVPAPSGSVPSSLNSGHICVLCPPSEEPITVSPNQNHGHLGYQ